MTHPAVISTYDLLCDSNHVLTVLERYRMRLPIQGHEAIVQHQMLHRELELHQDVSERALSQWREALAWRWECEVASQRFYHELRQKTHAYFGTDSPHLHAFMLTPNTNARTAAELLTDLHRVKAALKLIQPIPPFAPPMLERLVAICADLEAAVEQTHHCETQRRSAMLEQRITHTAYKRARVKTESLFAEYLGEQAVLELSDLPVS